MGYWLRHQRLPRFVLKNFLTVSLLCCSAVLQVNFVIVVIFLSFCHYQFQLAVSAKIHFQSCLLYYLHIGYLRKGQTDKHSLFLKVSTAALLLLYRGSTNALKNSNNKNASFTCKNALGIDQTKTSFSTLFYHLIWRKVSCGGATRSSATILE